MIRRLGYFALLLGLGATAALLKKLVAEADHDRDEPEAGDAPEPATKEAPAATKLTKISGIGPKLEEHLAAAGIGSCEELAESSTAELQGILDEAGSRFKLQDPSSWVEQAQLASAGKWDELAELQEELRG